MIHQDQVITNFSKPEGNGELWWASLVVLGGRLGRQQEWWVVLGVFARGPHLHEISPANFAETCLQQEHYCSFQSVQPTVMSLQGQNDTGTISLTVLLFCMIRIWCGGCCIKLIARTPGPQPCPSLTSLAHHCPAFFLRGKVLQKVVKLVICKILEIHMQGPFPRARLLLFRTLKILCRVLFLCEAIKTQRKHYTIPCNTLVR